MTDPHSKSEFVAQQTLGIAVPSPASLRELDLGLNKVSQLGSNVIVGWRRMAAGLQIVFMPA